MIHEYAIDPEFLFELLDKPDMASALCRALKGGTGCVTSGYPDEMGEKAYTLAKERAVSATDPRHKARWQERINKITELAAGLTCMSTKRYNAQPWQQSFALEHGRFPFKGILSGKSEQGLPVNNVAWLRSGTCHLFDCPRQCTVARNSAELSHILTPLLQNAEKITFIDPYFFAEPRFNSAYVAYFNAISQANHVRLKGQREICVICGVDSRGHSATYFKQECEEKIPKIIAQGLKICIHRIKEYPQGQEIHNRYVITDVGGVFLGYGTDSSRYNPNSHDDISILDPGPFAKWKTAYTPGSSVFDWSEPPVVIESSQRVP